jgi:ketosteroid isomerase-like protein
LHPNEQVIQKFYESFHARDAAGMTACYDPHIIFSDPAFGTLEGQEAVAMWHMLCGRARDLEVSVSNIRADDTSGSANWQAMYLFGKDHRPVHNMVQAVFDFRDGKIVRHIDSFDMWRWTRMALGSIGTVLGWSPFLRSAIRKSVRRQLDEYMQGHSA